MYPVASQMNDVEGDSTGPSGSALRGSTPRRRTPTACLHCRKRKIKCNTGEGDTCDKCRAQNKQCIVLSVTCEEAIRSLNLEPENLLPSDLRNLIQRSVQQGHLSHADIPTNFLSTYTRQMSNPPANLNAISASPPPAQMRTGQNMRDGSPSYVMSTPTIPGSHVPDYSSVSFASTISHVPRQNQQCVHIQRHSNDSFNPAPIQVNPRTVGILATAAPAPAASGGNHPRQYLCPGVPATFGTSIHPGDYTAYTEHRVHTLQFLGQDQIEPVDNPSYDYINQTTSHLRYPDDDNIGY